MNATPLATGFRDPVRDSQQVFRAAMDAMARPGTLHRLASRLEPPAGLAPGMAALALSLVDYETPVWLDAALAGSPAVVDYLRFHTGAPQVSHPAVAAFALVGTPALLPALDAFALGTPDYPDRSTTLFLAVDSLDDESGWCLTGPGIDGDARFDASPLPSDFVARRRALAPLFPRGLDIVFAAGDRIAALPRTTRVEA